MLLSSRFSHWLIISLLTHSYTNTDISCILHFGFSQFVPLHPNIPPYPHLSSFPLADSIRKSLCDIAPEACGHSGRSHCCPGTPAAGQGEEAWSGHMLEIFVRRRVIWRILKVVFYMSSSLGALQHKSKQLSQCLCFKNICMGMVVAMQVISELQ